MMQTENQQMANLLDIQRKKQTEQAEKTALLQKQVTDLRLKLNKTQEEQRLRETFKFIADEYLEQRK